LSESITGPNSGNFSQTGGTCGASLAAKSSCSIDVTFQPTSAGASSATMVVTDSDDPDSPHMVELKGRRL
jgi:hypothetical protein